MSIAVLAARTLKAITDHPEQYNQRHWMIGRDELGPNEPIRCGTTLCVAGHAVHQAGLTVRYDLDDRCIYAVDATGRVELLDMAAARLLGLPTLDAPRLFGPDVQPVTVRAVLGQLAAGAAFIDWAAAEAAA